MKKRFRFRVTYVVDVDKDVSKPEDADIAEWSAFNLCQHRIPVEARAVEIKTLGARVITELDELNKKQEEAHEAQANGDGLRPASVVAAEDADKPNDIPF